LNAWRGRRFARGDPTAYVAVEAGSPGEAKEVAARAVVAALRAQDVDSSVVVQMVQDDGGREVEKA